MNHPDRAPGVTLVTDRPRTKVSQTYTDIAREIAVLDKTELIFLAAKTIVERNELLAQIDALNALEDERRGL